MGGSVGIATTTPGGYYGEKLTVNGNSLLFGTATTTGNTTLASTLYVKDGNVGVGATAPVAKLDIRGDDGVSGTLDARQF
jgi:hypothetical protein